MQDLTIAIKNQPGALAAMGEALARSGVSIEGGGAWLHDIDGVGHFLFKDGEAARQALASAGITVLDQRDVLVQRLNQDQPGQLGKLARRMADAGVNIETLYSDHEHQLILVVDDMSKGSVVSESWNHERVPNEVPDAVKASRKAHRYAVSVIWTGGDVNGTRNYRSYRRDFSMAAYGKPIILGSSDPTFRGDASRYNPEEMLVGSLASCHMLTYLHLCAVSGIRVLAYEDQATGLLREDAQGSGLFEQVVLHPNVVVAEEQMLSKADLLHHQAHELCFISRSVNFQVTVEATVNTALA